MISRLAPLASGCSLLLALLLAGCAPGKETLRKRADAHFAAGAFDKAEIEYRNSLKADPANAHAIAQLGLIFAEQGRSLEAVQLLHRARSLQPENLEVRVALARYQIATKALPAARTELRHVLDHQPTHPEAPGMLAECSTQPAEWTESRSYLEKLSTAETAPVLFALALLELRQQRTPQAEALLQRAKTLDPKLPGPRISSGILHQSRQQLPEADAEFAAVWSGAAPRSPARLFYPRFKLQSGDVAGARRLLTELTTQVPDLVAPYLILAELAAKENQPDEALRFISQALERDQYSFSALLLRTRLLLQKNKPDEALPIVEQLLQMQPKNPDFLYHLALCQLAKKDPAKAIVTLNQLLTLAPEHGDAMLLLAETHLRKGEPMPAIPLMEGLLKKLPDLVPAKMLLGRAYAARGQTDQALALYQEIAATSPKDATLLLPVVQILRFQKKAAEARTVLLRALALAPDSLPVNEHLIDLDLMEGHTADARRRAEGLLGQHPANAAACLLMTRVELAEKKFSAAEAQLVRAIELQPGLLTSYYLLASIYGETKQDAKAITQLQELARREPKNPSYPMRIALLSERIPDLPAARTAYEQVLALDPKFVPALNNLAYLLANQLGDPATALPLAQKARELAPLDPNVADTLAWIYFKQGQYAAARNLLMESAAKSPDDPISQFHLGLAHYMTGDFATAQPILQRVLQLRPQIPEAAEIRRRLAVLALIASPSAPSAKTDLEKYLAEDARDPAVLTLLAGLHEQAGELDRADQRIQAALAINPRFVPASLGQIRVLVARHQIPAALDLAKNLRKQNPDDPAIGHQLGRLAFTSGDYTWAASLLQESARKLPNDPAVLYDHARATYSIGRVPEAESVFQRLRKEFPNSLTAGEGAAYLELIALARVPAASGVPIITRQLQAKPDFVPALIAQATWAEQQADLTSARQSYEKVLSHYPEFFPAKRSLTLLAALSEEADPKAYDRANQVREVLPGDAEIARALGILACRKGDFTRAASLLKESQSKLGEQPRALYFLGLAQLRLKDAAARQTLQRALELGLPPGLAQEAGKWLAEMK